MEEGEEVAAGRFRAVVADRVLDESLDLPEAKVAVVLGGCTSTPCTRSAGEVP